MKWIVIVICLVLVAVVGRSWLDNNTAKPDSTKTLQVATSFYPLFFFASEIGGDKARIFNLTPPGAEPHDYELTPQDLTTIEQSNILIVSGELEPWVDRIAEVLENKQIRIVTAAEGLLSLEAEEDGERVRDPHIWLDPILAKKEVEVITRSLVEQGPDNAAYYQANAEDLSAKLDVLDQEFQVGLKNCQHRTIVTSHAAFGYLAKRYGLIQIPISGLSPEEEPSPGQLADLVQTVKNQKIKYIFFETLVSPRLAETLAQEVGAQVLVFNPLEGLTVEEQAQGQDYFTVQRQNLAHLKMALECQ